MKKCLFILLTLFLVPFLDVKAANNCYDYPDFPFSLEENDYIIYGRTDETIRLLELPKSADYRIGYTQNLFWVVKPGSWYGVNIHVLENNSWKYVTNGASIGVEYVIYTSVPLYSKTGYHDMTESTLLYSANTCITPMIEPILMSKSAYEDLDKNSTMLVEVDFSNSYDSSYKYQVKTGESSWEDVTNIINVNTYRTVEKMQYYNTSVYARVLDSSDNVLYENSIAINELNDFSIAIENGLMSDENDNLFYNVEVDFLNAYDENLTYRYSFDNEKWFNITELSPQKVFSLNTGLDIDIFFQISNADNEIVLNQAYRDFYDLDNSIIIKEDYRIDENDDYIYILEVDFNNVKKYEYLHSNSNFKYYISSNEDFSVILTDLTDLLDENNKYVFEFSEQEYERSNFNYSFVAKIDNAEITAKKVDITRVSFDDKITNIQDEKLNEELNQDYSDTNNIVNSTKNFIKSISTFVREFFRLIMYFFNKLNIWIRTTIISLFIVMIICKIIKVVRK